MLFERPRKMIQEMMVYILFTAFLWYKNIELNIMNFFIWYSSPFEDAKINIEIII